MTTFKLRPDGIEWQQLDNEIVALNSERAEYVTIEGAGVVLWPTLQQGATREELIAALVERYGIDPAQAGTDVDVFLAELGEKGLLAS